MPHPTCFFLMPAPDMSAEVDATTGEHPRLKVVIPGPVREYLSDKGMLVPRNGYWLRRLRDGDVIEVRQGAPRVAVSQPVNPAPVAADAESAQDVRPALSRAEGDGCEPEAAHSGETTSPTASVRTGRANRASSKKE